MVSLKHFVKFTGMHLSLFSICNDELHWKRAACMYSFLWVLWIFLRTLLLWKTSFELVLKGEFFEKWRIDILFINKRYPEVEISLSLNRHCESLYLRSIDRKLTLKLTAMFNSFINISFLQCVTKIFCISFLLFSGKNLGVF